MYDMVNIFEVFLPQLLRYPNPTDPLNGEAAALMMREPKSYEAKVKGRTPHLYITPPPLTTIAEYVLKYASKDATADVNDDSDHDSEMSSVGDVASDDDEPAGAMDGIE